MIDGRYSQNVHFLPQPMDIVRSDLVQHIVSELLTNFNEILTF